MFGILRHANTLGKAAKITVKIAKPLSQGQLLNNIMNTVSRGIRGHHSRSYITSQINNQLSSYFGSSSRNQSLSSRDVQRMFMSPFYRPRAEVQLRDPGVARKHQFGKAIGAFKFADVKHGRTFVNGINYKDVKQGSLKNSGFHSALSSIARDNPNFIKNAIKNNGNGTYTVRFGDAKNPKFVTVDDDFLQTKSGKLIYGQSKNSQKELWPAIMEKAYAKAFGGNSYNRIQSHSSERVLENITGRNARTISTARYSERGVLNLAKKATLIPITAKTKNLPRVLEKATGLEKNHNYTVAGYEKYRGQDYVVLRNPKGRGEWKGKGADSYNTGLFRIPAADFKRYFGTITRGQAG